MIEGTDGSGKQTQTKLLYDKLRAEGYDCMKISFPQYGKPIAKPVEAYLAGELGDQSNVNIFGTSLMYAVDRFESVKNLWGEFYKSGGVVLADRYPTSNILHQGTKLEGDAREDYVKWLKDTEYGVLEIPEPDMVIYLHVDPEVGEKLLEARIGKEGVQHDILESDKAYQRRCKQEALSIAESENWQVIKCTDGGNMRTIENIHAEIREKVRSILP